MSTTPSNPTTERRITPADEAFLRRFRAEMKFAHAGPLVTLLDPIRPVKPERGPSGVVLRRQPRYAATSAESWTIGACIPAMASALEAVFGREYGSVLDEVQVSAPLHDQLESAARVLGRDKSLDPPRPKRRRGSRGGRKPAAA